MEDAGHGHRRKPKKASCNIRPLSLSSVVGAKSSSGLLNLWLLVLRRTVRPRMGCGRRSRCAAVVAAGAGSHGYTSPPLPRWQEPTSLAVLWHRQGGPGCFGQLPDLPVPQAGPAGCSQLRRAPEERKQEAFLPCEGERREQSRHTAPYVMSR